MARLPNRREVTRYWPFVVLALLWLLISTPATGPSTLGTTAQGGLPSGASGSEDGVDAATPSDGSAVASSEPGAVARSTGGAPAGSARGGASGGAGAAAVPGADPATGAPSAGQRVDNLGRPVEGDRSKCAADGRQEDVSFQSPPCMPKFTGSNAGATYQGVTADSIKVVMFYREFGQGVQEARAAAGTTMSEPQAREAHDIIAEFINRRYELYGRKIDVVEHFAFMADDAAVRAEAKRVNEVHRPFAVAWYVQPGMPAAFADQLSRLGVMAIGVGPLADEYFVERSPYVWTATVQGYRLADMVGDYYCKRMYGKPATLAGDPALQVKTRKLAVVSSEAPESLVIARRIVDQTAGGMCGSAAGVGLYTFSADPAEASDQQNALVTRLKNDGVTTVFGGIFAGQEMDRQRYLPEHLLGELVDDDLVGRIFVALTSPVQMQNSVGVGFWTEGQPDENQEFYRVMRSVRPDYDPPYPSRGPFDGLMFLGRVFQHAGPNLNPQTFLAGARTVPQIAGWENPQPWPGWKCCSPYAPMYHTGLDDKTYGAKVDARQIYWDNRAVSKQDNALGAYVSPDGGRRYPVGRWTKGEPRQP